MEKKTINITNSIIYRNTYLSLNEQDSFYVYIPGNNIFLININYIFYSKILRGAINSEVNEIYIFFSFFFVIIFSVIFFNKYLILDLFL